MCPFLTMSTSPSKGLCTFLTNFMVEMLVEWEVKYQLCPSWHWMTSGFNAAWVPTWSQLRQQDVSKDGICSALSCQSMRWCQCRIPLTHEYWIPMGIFLWNLFLSQAVLFPFRQKNKWTTLSQQVMSLYGHFFLNNFYNLFTWRAKAKCNYLLGGGR